MKKIILLLLVAVPILVSVSVIVLKKADRAPDQTADIALVPASFSQLPGWDTGQQAAAFLVLQKSCRQILKAPQGRNVGSIAIPLTAQDWQPICQAALKHTELTTVEARQFFQHWFKPSLVKNGRKTQGLFTGYFLPEIPGSLQRTSTFTAPLYSRPDDLITINLGQFSKQWRHKIIFGKLIGHHIVPYPLARADINQGRLMGQSKILAWTTPTDRFFLQVQGSGRVSLPGGKKLLLGYHDQNGLKYTAIGHYFIEKGIFTRQEISMQALSDWLKKHPQKAKEIMESNRSFVFFRKLPGDAPLGTQQVALTAGRSLAVDPHFIPLGAPVWLDTARPQLNAPQKRTEWRRLMIAQDTGGAIRGAVRGDVYWGAGKEAAILAGHMQSNGRYWVLLPKEYTRRT